MDFLRGKMSGGGEQELDPPLSWPCGRKQGSSEFQQITQKCSPTPTIAFGGLVLDGSSRFTSVNDLGTKKKVSAWPRSHETGEREAVVSCSWVSRKGWPSFFVCTKNRTSNNRVTLQLEGLMTDPSQGLNGPMHGIPDLAAFLTLISSRLSCLERKLQHL